MILVIGIVVVVDVVVVVVVVVVGENVWPGYYGGLRFHHDSISIVYLQDTAPEVQGRYLPRSALLSQAPDADTLHPAKVIQPTTYNKFNDIFYGGNDGSARMRRDGMKLEVGSVREKESERKKERDTNGNK